MRVSKIGGTFLGRPRNKDYNILGVCIGVHLFWETTIHKVSASACRA